MYPAGRACDAGGAPPRAWCGKRPPAPCLLLDVVLCCVFVPPRLPAAAGATARRHMPASAACLCPLAARARSPVAVVLEGGLGLSRSLSDEQAHAPLAPLAPPGSGCATITSGGTRGP